MANGLARVTTVVGAVLGFTPSEISKIRSAVLGAAEDSKPVAEDKLLARIEEYKRSSMSKMDPIHDTLAGAAIFALDVECDEALAAWNGGVDGAEILKLARRENERAARGLELAGGGDVPHDTWHDARAYARNIDHKMMDEDKAVALLSSKDAVKDRLRVALGRFAAGYQAAVNEMGKMMERSAISRRRAAEAEVINDIHFNDNLRRARYAGNDTSVLLEQRLAGLMPKLEKALADGMSRGIKDGMAQDIADLKASVSQLTALIAAPITRPSKDGE